MLNSKVEQVTLDEAESWVRRHTLMHERIYLLGTGGNINKLHKIANINDNRPLSYLTLNTLYNQLDALTYEERIVDLGLNPDRSDVILLAAKLFIKILNWSGAKDIYVPKVGLSDGMIRELYKRK